MERYVIKEKIKKLQADGVSVEEIRKNYGIDEDIISEFEEEKKIKKQIDRLLGKGDTEEVQQIIDGIDSEAFKLHLLIKVAANKGDMVEKERLLRKLLEIQPNSIRSMSSLINVLRAKLDESIINNDRNLKLDISSEIIELAERQLKLEPMNPYAYASIIKCIKVKINNTDANEKEEIEKLKEREKEALNSILNIDPSNVRALGSLFKILSEEGNFQEACKISERLLEQKPNDIKEIATLINLVRRNGDTEKEKELLYRILEIDNKNRKAMSSLLKIAKEEGNQDDRRKILYRILEVEPRNTRIIHSLIRIAENRNMEEEEKELLHKLLSVEPLNKEAKAKLMQLISKEKNTEAEKVILEYVDTSLIEETMENEAENPLEKARRIIYESEDILADSEQIKELIDGESEINKNLVLAELYLSTGLQKRAEGLLKGYKKQLDSENDKDKVRLINQALELIKGSNKKNKGSKTKWQAFWDQKNEQEKSKIKEGNTEFEKVSYPEDVEER